MMKQITLIMLVLGLGFNLLARNIPVLVLAAVALTMFCRKYMLESK